jgi:aromatic ring-opening dioxygenase catalytic subunit (LigB family)
MGEIVGAFGLSHAPGITAYPEAAPPDQLATLLAAFQRVQGRIADLNPDAIVVITPEHWTNFFLDNMPAFCIGMAERYRGPTEDWLRVDRTDVPGHPELARAMLEDAMDAGIEPAFAHELLLDHGAMVPLHFTRPAMDVPVVPIILNCLQPPFPRATRCYAFGQSIGRTLRARGERVVVIASGGLSHWPGHVRHGTINQPWDRRFLDLVLAGEGEQLSQYSEEEIAEGGTGGQEIRPWITLLGATGAGPAALFAYEPVTAFATGYALVEIEIARG